MAVASEKALQGTVSTAPTVVDSSDSLNLFHSPSFFGANTAASEKVLLSLPPCVPLCAKRRFMPSLLLYYSLGVESRSILPRGGAVSTKSLRGVFDCIHNGWCDGWTCCGVTCPWGSFAQDSMDGYWWFDLPFSPLSICLDWCCSKGGMRWMDGCYSRLFPCLCPMLASIWMSVRFWVCVGIAFWFSKSKKAQLGSLVRVAASATPRAKFQPTLNLMTTLKVTSSACQVQRHDCSAFASRHDPCCRCSRRWNHLATDSKIELFGGSGGFWMVLCIRLLPTGAASTCKIDSSWRQPWSAPHFAEEPWWNFLGVAPLRCLSTGWFAVILIRSDFQDKKWWTIVYWLDAELHIRVPMPGCLPDQNEKLVYMKLYDHCLALLPLSWFPQSLKAAKTADFGFCKQIALTGKMQRYLLQIVITAKVDKDIEI